MGNFPISTNSDYTLALGKPLIPRSSVRCASLAAGRGGVYSSGEGRSCAPQVPAEGSPAISALRVRQTRRSSKLQQSPCQGEKHLRGGGSEAGSEGRGLLLGHPSHRLSREPPAGVGGRAVHPFPPPPMWGELGQKLHGVKRAWQELYNLCTPVLVSARIFTSLQIR